ncbi:hypothetical protein Cs7R123_55350 [Catellatospora sp. TT07R-123]|uniref:hypothetical protein n=1 Tax=Catellatospora sp. TT07R-123 TaxID=2733863 RepID=UPI001B233EF3|nr:hypothetical protein [Catellatospora sp. TT07R-123]GHJ48193.1 hypothetical protein Cs7R123_55350 [Catellatospora sp. TT07R-123]
MRFEDESTFTVVVDRHGDGTRFTLTEYTGQAVRKVSHVIDLTAYGTRDFGP